MNLKADSFRGGFKRIGKFDCRGYDPDWQRDEEQREYGCLAGIYHGILPGTCRKEAMKVKFRVNHFFVR